MADNRAPQSETQQQDEIAFSEADPGYDREQQEPERDPLTARNDDPAAMSEHERNLRQSEQYNTGA